jgi:hypothetical protein
VCTYGGSWSPLSVQKKGNQHCHQSDRHHDCRPMNLKNERVNHCLLYLMFFRVYPPLQYLRSWDWLWLPASVGHIARHNIIFKRFCAGARRAERRM